MALVRLLGIEHQSILGFMHGDPPGTGHSGSGTGWELVAWAWTNLRNTSCWRSTRFRRRDRHLGQSGRPVAMDGD